MTELKRCPFCGNDYMTTSVLVLPYINIISVKCVTCGIAVNPEVKWNTRPIEDELNARIAQLTAERDILQDKFETLELDYRDVCQKRLEAADSFSKQIIDLTNDRDEWRKDAERFIQLANYNNKRAGEYFELHEQLVEKYGTENPASDAEITG